MRMIKVGRAGFEPTTTRSVAGHSIQLNYRPGVTSRPAARICDPKPLKPSKSSRVLQRVYPCPNVLSKLLHKQLQAVSVLAVGLRRSCSGLFMQVLHQQIQDTPFIQVTARSGRAESEEETSYPGLSILSCGKKGRRGREWVAVEEPLALLVMYWDTAPGV